MTIAEFNDATKWLNESQRNTVLSNIEQSGRGYTEENVMDEIRNFAS